MTETENGSDLVSTGEAEGKFYGKYRGVVVQNMDPDFRGRIQVQVPDVVMLPSTWAEACVPFTGKSAGFFHVPPIGSSVWVEFEQGDPDYPIWVGSFWGSAMDVPTDAQIPPIPLGQNIVIQTQLETMLSISDVAPTPETGGIILQSATGAKIVVNDSGIYIDNGMGASIKLIGPAVMINDDGLTII